MVDIFSDPCLLLVRVRVPPEDGLGGEYVRNQRMVVAGGSGHPNRMVLEP